MNKWINQPIILENDQVKLVPLEKAHFDELIEISKDERIWEFMPITWLGKKDLRQVLNDALTFRDEGHQYPFIAIDKSTNKIFGSTRYLKINHDFKNLEIGWTWYKPEYWGSGYNKVCKFLLLQHCFEVLHTISVHLGTADTNIRSRKAIESLGATYEGTLCNRIIWNGINRSFAIYSITDNEWPEVKSKLFQIRKDINF
jgi:RimJ/RimL family protein N-acetyltransferase